MIPLGRTAAVLLAAGLSIRFGDRNKLLAPFRGKPLVAHAAATIASLPFESRLAVTPEGNSELADLLGGFGFEIVENPDPAAGREQSLRLGLARAMAAPREAVMVLLGDMPHVEPSHVEALAALAGPDRAAISASGKFSAPPLIVPARLAQEALAGERPLRQSLAGAAELMVSTASLIDYDTADDFARDALRAAS